MSPILGGFSEFTPPTPFSSQVGWKMSHRPRPCQRMWTTTPHFGTPYHAPYHLDEYGFHPLAVPRQDWESNEDQPHPVPPVFGVPGIRQHIRGNKGGFMRGNRVYAGWTQDAWDDQRAIYEAQMDVTRRERRQRRAFRHCMARMIQVYYRDYKSRNIVPN